MIYMMLKYVRTNDYTTSIWVSGIVIVIFSVGKIYLSLHRISPFLLLNVSKREYDDVHQFLSDKMEEGTQSEKIEYHRKYPYLLIITGVKQSVINEWMKELDKMISKKPKYLAWFQYIYFLVGLILIVLLWRF